MWLLQQWVVYFFFRTLEGVQKCCLFHADKSYNLCTCLKVFKLFFFVLFFCTKRRMFSVMLNVAMREGALWDNNMHKEQCIGPGHGASPWCFPVCFSGSVYRQIHYCKQLVMGKVWGQGPSLNEWHHLVDKQSSSLCLLCYLELAGGDPISEFWERDQAWTGRRGDASVTALTQSAVTLAWRLFKFFFFSSFIFFESGLLCAV